MSDNSDKYYIVEHINYHKAGGEGVHYTIEDREPCITERDGLPTERAMRLLGTYCSLESAKAAIPEHYDIEQEGPHALPWIVAEYRYDGYRGGEAVVCRDYPSPWLIMVDYIGHREEWRVWRQTRGLMPGERMSDELREYDRTFDTRHEAQYHADQLNGGA